jgi:hypothetical protein
MFDDLKKKLKEDNEAAEQAKLRKDTALAELGQLWKKQTEILTPIVEEVLTQYNEAMELGLYFDRGILTEPHNIQHEMQIGQDTCIMSWKLTHENYSSSGFSPAVIYLKANSKGVPVNFVVCLTIREYDNVKMETPDLTQESLVRAIKELYGMK